MSETFWAGRSVFVTGATGLLGGWLVKRLIEHGAEVVILVRDRLPDSFVAREGLLRSVRSVEGTLGNFSLLRRAFSEYAIDTVFHLAAQAIVSTAKIDPMGTLEANVQGTWHVLEACRVTGIKQVVIASSDKAYGNARELPYVESHPLEGRYPYDVSKSCADLISTMYAQTYGLPVTIVRCANLFGGGDLNFNRIIPDVIRTTFRGQRFVIRSDGKFVRDWIYVKDGADAYLRLAERLATDHHLRGEAFNFSMGVRITVLEIVQRVLALMGCSDLEPIIQNTASHEIREQYVSCEKAHALLGWTHRYELDDALAETIAWYGDLLNVESLAAPRATAPSSSQLTFPQRTPA